MIARNIPKSRFAALFSILFLVLLVGIPVQAQDGTLPSDETTITDGRLWDVPVTYARSLNYTTRVFTAPQDDAQFTPDHETYKGSLLALQDLPDHPGWYWVIPNNGIYNPWLHWNRVENVYVKDEDFEVVDDFDPVSVYSDSIGVDRQVVAIRSVNPELLLIEKGDIILRVPVGMGWDKSIPRDQHQPEDSPTPLGEFAIAKVSPSRHMSIYPGVPFVMYYSGGMALHESYWIPWNDTYRGNFWTGGCLNVPDYSRWNIDWEGKQYSVEHWLFKWGISNFRNAGYDPYKYELFDMKYDDELYQNRMGTLRVLIVSNIEDLYQYLTPGDYPAVKGALADWTGVIDQYHTLVNNKLWRLPHSENGQSSFMNVTYHEMAERDPR